MNAKRKENRLGDVSTLVLKLRRGFFKMTMREKVLALLFVVALVGLWASTQAARFGSVFDSIGSAHYDAREQESWLAQQTRVNEEFDSLVADLKLEDLPNRDEVSSQIDALVRRYGFPDFNFGQARTERGVDLAFHTISLNIQKVTYPQLKKFTAEFKNELPFVSLESISIRPQARDDRFLDVVFVLKSIEYMK